MIKLIHVGATVAALGAAGAAPVSEPVTDPVTDPVTQPARPHETLALRLEQIKEVRRTDFTASADAGFSLFDTPGLELRFAIVAPAGVHIVEVQQPAILDAVDSAGTDLGVLPPGTFGRDDHVETIREWEAPPHALTFKLALPAREAKYFSLRSRMNALTYRDLETATLTPDSGWAQVNGDLFGATTVKMRLERKRGSVQVVFSPGSVREMIDTVKLTQSGIALEREGVMWNDLQAGYMFTANPSASGSGDAAFTAMISVRKGLKTIPVEIDLREQPLP